jgi:chromosome segregation ATPase
MTPDEREEALARREENAALLTAKLERDRKALESEISASAAASKAASSINRALQADAAKKLKNVEAETAVLEAKLLKLKTDIGKATPAQPEAPAQSPADRAAIAAAQAELEVDRASLEAERAAFARESEEISAKNKAEVKALADLRAKLVTIRSEIEAGVKTREAEVHKKEAAVEADRTKLQASAGALARTEAQLSEQRTKLEGQVAALAAKEAMYEERHRQLQENMKNFART